MRVVNEKVSHPGRSLRFLRFEVPRFAAPRHRHRHLELTWIERGAGLRYLGDTVQPFEAGDLVLVGEDVAHCWISSRGSGTAVATVVQFPPDLFAPAGLPELRSAALLARDARRGIVFRGETARIARHRLAQMQDTGALARLGLLLSILDALARAVTDRSFLDARPARAGARGSGAAPADRVVEWIRRTYPQRLSVAAAARIAHVTPAAFSRFFRREVGRSFVAYVNDVRCSEAQLRLRDPDLAVERIARECGFATLSNFNRQFRLRTGMPPREFRRRS